MNKRRNLPIVKGVAAATMFGLGISGQREAIAGLPASFERVLKTPAARRDADGNAERRRLSRALTRAEWAGLHDFLSSLGDEALFSPDAAAVAARETPRFFANGGLC